MKLYSFETNIDLEKNNRIEKIIIISINFALNLHFCIELTLQQSIY